MTAPAHQAQPLGLPTQRQPPPPSPGRPARPGTVLIALSAWAGLRAAAFLTLTTTLVGLTLLTLASTGHSRLIPAPPQLHLSGGPGAIWETPAPDRDDRLTGPARDSVTLQPIPPAIPATARDWYAHQLDQGWAPQIAIAGGAPLATTLTRPDAPAGLTLTLILSAATMALAGRRGRRAAGRIGKGSRVGAGLGH